MVNFDKCCIREKNVLAYVNFADFVVNVVEHLTSVITPVFSVFSLDFSLMKRNLDL